MEWIYQNWSWYVSGFLIGLCMLLLTYFGKNFGISSNLRTLCAMSGAGKFSDFFRFDWKNQRWNLVVVVGMILGGFMGTHLLDNGSGVKINPTTIEQLATMNIDAPEGKLVPDALFSLETIRTPKGFLILLGGGMLIGFGTRYAGGCTSGHAISGLSNLQISSLIAVIGFFIGGLIMVHLLLPLIF